MQHSMTGYGLDERTSESLLIKTEIKTLNSKFLDFSPRVPKALNSVEATIRNMVTDQLKRGKVMLTLEIEAGDKSSELNINEELFRAYHAKFRELSDIVNESQESLFKMALQAPDVLTQQELDIASLPMKDILESIKSAISQCIAFRANEGEALEVKLKGYLHEIRNGLAEIEKNDASRIESIKARLQKNLDEIKHKVQIDTNRFEQELIFYTERLDISEEKVRLKQHLDYFLDVLNSEAFAGKKLGFIAQEIGREINTIGSKANHAEIQRRVVIMKDELEKIKEQVLNIL